MEKRNKKYIIYGLLDLDDKPFYIGFGMPTRPRQHFYESKRVFTKGTNKHKILKIRQIFKKAGTYPKIKIYYKNLSYKKACELEIKMIAKIGINNLTNLHKGGEGGFFNSWPKERVRKAIAKMRATKNRQWKNGEIKSWNKGHTAETDVRIAQYTQKGRITKIKRKCGQGKKNPMYGKRGANHPAYGYKCSLASRLKRREQKLGLKNPQAKKCKIISPEGKVYVGCVNEFIRLYGSNYRITPWMLRELPKKQILQGWRRFYYKKKEY